MRAEAPARRAALNAPPRAGAIEVLAAVAIGGLLTFAAVMKIIAAVRAEGEAATGAETFAVAPLEVAFALLLIVFRARWWAWASAAALFAAFAGFAGFRAYWGSASCGCFGELSLSPQVTMGIDVAIALVATAIAARRALGMFVIGPIATIAGVMAVLGSGVGLAMADPRPQDYGDDATAQLLALDFMRDVVSRAEGGPAWFLYIFNPECPICMDHLPEMRERELAWKDSGTLRVRAVSMFELEAYESIPMYAWGTPPLTLLVERGIVTRRASGIEMLDPDAIAIDLTAQRDLATRLREIPEIAGALSASAAGPARLIYIYSAGCGVCLEHLRRMEAFTQERSEDSALRILPFSRDELISRGVDPVLFKELRIAFLVQEGAVTRTYDADSIPDPLVLWAELSSR